MSDKKVSQLTHLTTLTGAELVYVVGDPAGTPVPRYATTQEIADMKADPTIASQAEAEAGVENTKMMTALRTAQAIAALGGGAVGYLEYVAIISQTGAAAPTATVIKNTLGGTPIFSRTATGRYRLTLASAFTVGKTYKPNLLYYYPAYANVYWAAHTSPGFLSFVSENAEGTYADDLIVDVHVRILVYP